MPLTPPTALRADCSRCVGLCCAASALARSADFAIDKPAGRACPNLRADFRCAIHADLRGSGFGGCAVYDCFGAGQRVTEHTFAGRDWRRTPALASRMFDAFHRVHTLHQLMWLLTEALDVPAAQERHPEIQAALDQTDRLAGREADALLALDVQAHRGAVNLLLVKVSEIARAAAPGPRLDRRGADLVGADLRRTDLRGACLRGAWLIGADLRGRDLTLADLTGADLRGADVRGADLSRSLFVTQSQLASALGDATTRLPASRAAPGHWPGGL